MNHHVLIKDKKQMLLAYKKFKQYYGIDLDSKRYEDCDVKEAWDLVVQDIYGDNYSINIVAILKKYIKKLEFLQKEKGDGIVRTLELTYEGIGKRREYLMEDIKIIRKLVYSYSMLEPDIWLNAYLSAELIMNIDILKKNNVKIWDQATSDKKTWAIKRICSGFCEEFQTKFYSKNNRSSFLEYEEPIYECIDSNRALLNKRIEYTIEGELRLGRWSRLEIQQAEDGISKNLEDIIMFCKTVNGLLTRNIVDTLLEANEREIENYLYIISKICMLDSLMMQNFAWIIFWLSKQYESVLHNIRLESIIYELKESYLENKVEIKRKLTVLSGGLTYLIYKKYSKCDLENRSSLRDAVWPYLNYIYDFRRKVFGKCKTKLKNKDWTVAEKTTNKDFLQPVDWKWIYVLIQKYIIYWQSPQYKKKNFEINWYVIFQTIEFVRENQPELYTKKLKMLRKSYRRYIKKNVKKREKVFLEQLDIREIVRRTVKYSKDIDKEIKNIISWYLDYIMYFM